MQGLKPTLNLGCGHDKWGDVRIDVSGKSAANLILDFDKNQLPFPDKYFREVRLFHVLEHSKNPQRLLNEAIRVGDRVHAKFPCKYDRVPFVLGMLNSLSWPAIRDAISHSFWHIMTQFGLADHPIAHRWLIKPFGNHHLNEIQIFPPPAFRSGRKAWLLRRLPLLKMSGEWECWL